MSDETYTEAEVRDLLEKLEEVDGLTEREQALLNAIVKMFKDVKHVVIDTQPEPPLVAFETEQLPGKAKLVMDYADPDSDSESSSGTHSQIAQYITRSPHS